MARSDKRFAPRDFLSVIDRIPEAVPLALEGMAKADPDDAGVLLFDPGLGCKHWVRLPVSAIESVTVLEQITCEDHSHPVVRVEFKAPETPEALAFAGLVRAYEDLLILAARRSERTTGAPQQRNDAVLPPDGGTGGGHDPCQHCRDQCDHDFPNSWFSRFLCKLHCC